ncbi:hypothetical protein EC2729250_3179 [Escherichia coli 2729250]|nr:hypothetical protein ECDEC10A_3919 [Escherichia coli DEC10A]EMV31356.1 hypothetical protein ECBCE002MS12_3048 [Escherichia coli BCE002_MS12]EMV92326.1 hypothetical protein EC2860050_3240 [Escherichia coli 2860050]EMW49923.1 hypothetical protein EC2770900_3134 [Escherichia coli 2770900]EMW66938.1 hypothetical protein EC2749250_3367 [Escherichia coli 2749250]EMW73599.1 hypothetical protein EC2747800_3225 [Escherichia coli 2747800]EMX68604.1 hypothetical protein ECENVIRA101_3479 [Escherichia 
MCMTWIHSINCHFSMKIKKGIFEKGRMSFVFFLYYVW